MIIILLFMLLFCVYLYVESRVVYRDINITFESIEIAALM